MFGDKFKDWPAIKQVNLSDFEDPQYEIARARQEQRFELIHHFVFLSCLYTVWFLFRLLAKARYIILDSEF